MSTPVKLFAFVVVLALLGTGAAIAGNAFDPDRSEPADPHAEEAADSHGEGPAAEKGAHAGGAAGHPVRGVAVAEGGLRLAVENPELRPGRTETLRFRVLDEAGETVRDFDVEHTKRMHVIVARRDLSTFQHLHPEQAEDGGWSLPLELYAPGSYRIYGDFKFAGEAVTLASDLRVDGKADLKPLPAATAVATSEDGYDVRLDADRVAPGEEAHLRFTITRDGRTIEPEEYLGAGGHLVALREGDLAFLHVHPTDDRAAEFGATFPTAGRYRLFLQFKHDGRIQTVAYTREVDQS